MKKQLLTFLAILCIPFYSISQTCFPGWGYYRNILIDNTAGPALTDYQVGLTIPTGSMILAGKLNADGSDMRFSDMSCNVLSYYVDSAAGSLQNKVWVKVPSIPAGATTSIQFYYGNPSATNSLADGDATFIFFDDFEDNNIDPAKWNNFGAYNMLVETSGELRYNCLYTGPSRWKHVYTVADFSNRVVIDAGVLHDADHVFGFVASDSLDIRIYERPIGNANDTLRLVAITDTTSNGYYIPGNFDFPWVPVAQYSWNNLSYNIELLTAGLRFHQFADYTGGESASGPFDITFPGVTTNSGFKFCLSGIDFGSNAYSGLRYIKVRQGVETEPTYSPGPENNLNPVGINSVTSETFKIYPNPSSGDFTIEFSTQGNYMGVVKDVSGRIFWQGKIENKKNKLSFPEISAGVYSLEVSDENNLYVKKLIIR